MREGRIILILLTSVFLISEILFNYLVLTVGDGDLLGASGKTLIYLLFIFLFSKKINWARWTLSILLILFGILCLLAGFDSGPMFYFIGIYDIFFGIYIHRSKALEVFRTKANPSEILADTNLSDEAVIEERQKYEYPTLVRRYKALLIDGLLLLTTLIVIMLLVQDSKLRTTIMVSSALILLLCYEPLLTAYSKTIGQRMMKIRVGRYDRPLDKINLLNAYIRWFSKGLLGWLSFITIHFNQENRAIHDFASDSVMTIEE